LNWAVEPKNIAKDTAINNKIFSEHIPSCCNKSEYPNYKAILSKNLVQIYSEA
jgi:hypothetical protein